MLAVIIHPSHSSLLSLSLSSLSLTVRLSLPFNLSLAEHLVAVHIYMYIPYMPHATYQNCRSRIDKHTHTHIYIYTCIYVFTNTLKFHPFVPVVQAGSDIGAVHVNAHAAFHTTQQSFRNSSGVMFGH